MDDIGVIGVGHIGNGFLENLLADGYDVTVYDIDETKLERASERGASRATSPAALATAVDAVVMAVPGTPEVEATMGGTDGILASESLPSLIIDVTTTLPETSLECQTLCADADIRFLEAPITGGSPREGMHMIVGGSEADYDAASDLLDSLCTDHTRIGPVGDATIFKLGLQVRYAGHHAIDAEIIEFMRANDVDPDPLVDFLEFDIWERYFSGDFSQDIEGLGGLAIWHKDIGYARQVARETETALPLAGVLAEAYKATVRRTSDEEGHAAALRTYWQVLNGMEDGENDS
ncbi:NAD(P)-dependent oxidoreductase [Natronolimnobius sp. AArcel1]|nr:NAD(P)-dependent oxidoreductase [Natronolimnobius sp. AArcel1]